MFNIGWAEFLVLTVAGLFILGPERLPSAAAWLGRTVRQVREYATGAREQLRSQLGPEFDELRKPLEELRGIRGLSPRSALTRHLFDDLGGDPFDNWLKPNGFTPPLGLDIPLPRPLQPGERPPFDPDAT
ncbi:MAG TPA: Sec-independent protein translocase protein TatB [Pseudonocardiaceae bacterium]|jgi:sec-independent protein translocase protein TatB|nr:Sec-independent protein translocase protein TatB [Pseudonocardiaceae bacterium]